MIQNNFKDKLIASSYALLHNQLSDQSDQPDICFGYLLQFFPDKTSFPKQRHQFWGIFFSGRSARWQKQDVEYLQLTQI